MPGMSENYSHIRPIGSADIHGVLALNHQHETETSPLDADELNAMLATAFHTGLCGAADGFCIAMDQDSDYESPNFQWFAARHARFVYVDRIIIAPQARGRGLARDLYGALAQAARTAGHGMIGCEVNINPPNPGSEAFHARLGFEKVGEALLNGADKKVGYWVLRL